jgi:cation diffusion facilitator family transporter
LVAAGLIAYHSVREILRPHHAPESYTLVVLILVILTKEVLYRFVFRVGSELTSTALKGDAWHHRSDALTSAAAFVGISVALIGGPGYEAADDWAALLACAVIVFNGYRFLRASLDELMDAALPSDLRAAVEQEAKAVAGVRGVDICRIRKSGLGLFVDLQLRVDGEMTVRRADEIAEEVSRKLMHSRFAIGSVMVHVEPD